MNLAAVALFVAANIVAVGVFVVADHLIAQRKARR